MREFAAAKVAVHDALSHAPDAVVVAVSVAGLTANPVGIPILASRALSGESLLFVILTTYTLLDDGWTTDGVAPAV
jgi:hypothetical protein